MSNATTLPRDWSATVRALGLQGRAFATPADRAVIADIEQGLSGVERLLASELHFGDELADATTRYLIDSGGKRVRPALVLLAAQLGEGATPDVVTAAAAIELTHVATLYHDDVMDEAPLRRGRPTVHEVWGNAVAVLTGDLMFARASSLVAGLGEAALRLQSNTFERLCLGQLRETVGPRPGEDAIEHYLQVLRDKTGSLLSLAVQLGIVFSKAPAEYERPLIAYGEEIGLAFQLIDDVIDLSTQAEVTGKRAGTDLAAGVPTLPVLKLRRLAAEGDAEAGAIEARIARAQDAAETADGDGSLLAQVAAEIREHPVTAETIEAARAVAARGLAALEALPKGSVRKALTAFAEHVVSRTH